MSEQEPKPNTTETTESLSNHELDAITEKLKSEAESKAEQANKNVLSAEELAKKVEQHAISGEEMSHGEVADNKHHPVLVNKQLKDMAYSRAMTRVRKHLSLPSKLLSKAVHSKVLDKPSEVIGKTVARPSGMLGGAIFAAIGSSALLWITKHYGYEYNFLAVILLFGFGLVVGLAVEAGWKALRKRS